MAVTAPEEAEFVSVAAAAELLDVSERRVRQLAREEELLPYRQLVPRGRVRVRRRDVLRLLELRGGAR